MAGTKRIVNDVVEDVDDGDDDSSLRELVADIVVALIFLVGSGLLALGKWRFWTTFPVGSVGVFPATLTLVRIYKSRRGYDASGSMTTGAKDVLETLQWRYVAGELSEEEPEVKVERLLGTETVADARGPTASQRRESKTGETGQETTFNRD